MPIDSDARAIVGLTFLLAGIIKGAVGLGFSTVSLAVLTATMGFQPAMALQLAPSFVTHVWQAVAGSHAGLIPTRLWFFILTAVVTRCKGASIWTNPQYW
jgi:uncharacterized membrane protein YfcA